jgi:hypothetical protein
MDLGAQLLAKAPAGIQYNEHVEGDDSTAASWGSKASSRSTASTPIDRPVPDLAQGEKSGEPGDAAAC